MQTGLLLFALMLFSWSNDARSFTKSDFTNTAWFTNNWDRDFYHLDTVQFIRYSNAAPEWDEFADFAEDEMDFLGHGDFLEYHFGKKGKLKSFESRENYIRTESIGTLKWKFNVKEQRLETFRNEGRLFAFRPIAMRKITLRSQYSEHKNRLETIELTLVRDERNRSFK